MPTSISSRATTTLAAILLLMLGALTYATGARAAPGTVTGPSGLSVTVDDTTPAPGQVVNFDFSYTFSQGDEGSDTSFFTFGSNLNTSAPGVNLGELALGSCGGDITFCGYNTTSPTYGEFNGVDTGFVPGATITGTASFTVSATASDGDVIGGYGGHRTNGESVNSVATDSRLDLTVTAPPPPANADLGVDLSATAHGLLTSHINYDAAVTNNGPATATGITITTQLPTAATGITSSTCTYSSSTDQVSCPISSIANSATTHATFKAYFGLLTIGLPLHATATRTASSPTDPVATNDSDTAYCYAITPLLIHC
ncbi:DUF11 domain-containing protein [Conexibacter woesei]|uniref:DUF11 domain-containing protein n=1 Tax=Conexibacter woesei TaxID=191495 RepID=UPI000427EFB5|nr:DUF11 domain-containing protein [Conexibacter woesei]